MKKLRSSQKLPVQAYSRHGGFAIVTVLLFLILLAILIVGFLNRAGSERSAAAAYYEGNAVSILADQAVNIVQAQIDHASSQKNIAWASQPGMVRTFQANGDLLHAYKLYSDQAMVDTNVDVAAAVEELDGWEQRPGQFTDLNAPVFRTPDEEEMQPIYPIIDATAVGGGIEGFSVTDAPGSTSIQPVPMPVRWLYVLRDGTTVAAAEGADDKQATVAGASKANPIVGRIAFWTDDETAKLNVNTASHGSFWDIPRAFTLEERDRLARFQPALQEFQRYPGHPATTSLWPVFGYKFPGDDQITDDNGQHTYPEFSAFALSLAPRVEQGGSLGGTVVATTPVEPDGERLFSSVDELLFDAHQGVRTASTQLGKDDIEKAKFFLTARSNAPEINLFNLPRMAIWPINAGGKKPSTLDELVAFCSMVNGAPYYFQRSDPKSGTADIDGDTPYSKRNQELYHYINTLLAAPHPGFGESADTFAKKYTADETGQIVTEIFDYIRSSNLYSTALGADAYTAGNVATAGSGVGQVTPLKIDGTKGVGRIPVLSKAVFQLFVSGASSSLGGVFTPLPGKTPLYSDPLGTTPHYQQLTSFLDKTGLSDPVDLKTSGIIYFDTFDPMYGYSFPRYNFTVDVEFQGDWTVDGKPLGFPSTATLTINNDHHLLYDAEFDDGIRTWMGHYLGGLLGPQWMMQNYSSVAPNPSKTTGAKFNGPYPLVSSQVSLHPPFNLVKRNNAAPTGDLTVTLPSVETLPSSSISFSGGTVIAKLKVGSEVVQEYRFVFPPFTKPAPRYASRLAPLGSLNLGDDSRADDVLKQFAVSADFRNRWRYQPHAHRASTRTGAGNSKYKFVDVGLVQDGDVAVALEARFGDKRLLSGRNLLTTGTTAKDSFERNISYDNTSARHAVTLRTDPSGQERRNRANRVGQRPGRILDITYGQNAMPEVVDRYPHGVEATTQGVDGGNFTPDFDNGTFHMPDDAYVGRADEGSVYDKTSDKSVYIAWYLNIASHTNSHNSPTFYSPNKQMPSAVKFGSLPTGVIRNHPWQTLLFRPDPGHHPGAAGVPDYSLLDLFWMPVVEPYAISEPFSTNGKVNMNYQIMPFGYIQRSTAIRGVMQTEEVLSMHNDDAALGNPDGQGYGDGTGAAEAYEKELGDSYKRFAVGDTAATTYFSTKRFRKRFNLDETTGTLRSFEELFKDNRIFRSETEICTIPIVPEGEEWNADFEQDYWQPRSLTGDNSREAPYANLLPRFTTRSNTYTVHYRVQSLKKSISSDPTIWEEGKDSVVAELRGSRVIERYIDPNNVDIPDYAAAASPTSLDTLERFYRWRIIANREFEP